MEHRLLRGMHFIRVRGNISERVKAHMELLKSEIPDGAVFTLAKKNEWLIRRAPGITQNPIVQTLALQLYHQVIVPLLSSRLTREERQAIRTAEEESGIPFKVWREVIFQADSLMVLARTSVMRHLLPEWSPGSLPGCTSAVVLPEWTKSGRILACRNFDYFIVGPWEKNSTVIFNEPTETSDIPFVSLSTAGIQVGGVTAINREGITLSTHAHFGLDVSLRGRSIVLLGDELIRKAKSINDAVDIIRKNKTCANWAFVISSAKENQAVVVEMTPKRTIVRLPEDGFISHTNYFHSPELRKKEALICGSYYEDLQGRICQIKEKLQVNRGNIEPSHLSVILGDHQDYFSKCERVFGNTVSVVTTVKSTVFDPGAQTFWIASRKESPVGLGEYIEINMDRFWKEPAEEYERNLNVLPYYQPKNPNLLEAIKHYREAYRSYQTESHKPDYIEKTLEHLIKAAKAFPDDAHLWLQLGIFQFMLKDFNQAFNSLKNTLGKPVSKHVTSVRDLYLARCYDLQGNRKHALEIYQKHVNTQEPKLKKAFIKGMRKSYRKKDTTSIQIDLQFPDSLHY